MKYFWPNFAEKVKGNRGRRYGLRKKKGKKRGRRKKKDWPKSTGDNSIAQYAQWTVKNCANLNCQVRGMKQQQQQ